MIDETVLYGIRIEEPDTDFRIRAKSHFDAIAKPIDSLGDLETVICDIAAIQHTDKPDISKKALIVMCADNGVVDEGVSQTDKSVTLSVAKLLAKDSSSVGALTKGQNIKTVPVDIGIDCDEPVPGLIDKKVAKGTGNIVKTVAMTDEQCLAAVEAGIEIVRDCSADGINIIATGEMGIGNTTTSTALFCALTGEDPGKIAGRGAGLSDEGLTRKIEVIKKALALHGLSKASGEVMPEYAFNALCSVGGLDIAGLAGIYIGCAMYRIPVVIDGFISAVAALAADYIVGGCREYMIASHKGKEAGSARALELLDKKPVIDANMALGEGSGAVMIFPLLDMAMSLYDNGTGFLAASIEKYERFDT